MSTRSTRSKSSTASPDVEAQRAARFKSTVSRLAAEDASLSGLRLPLYHRADVTELCKVLTKNRGCNSVAIHGPGITDQACADIASTISQNRSITYLCVGHVDISGDGLEELSKGIYANRVLRSVKIGPIRKHTGLCETGTAKMLLACCEHETLERLELENIPIVKSFGKAFQRALPVTKSMKSLIMRKMALQDEAIEGLADGMRTTHRIQELILEAIPVTPAAIEKLLSVFTTAKSTIIRLHLKSLNFKSLSTMEKVAQILDSAPLLKDLEVSGGQVSTEGANRVLKRITRNCALQILNLSSNDITDMKELDLSKTTILTSLDLSRNKLHHDTLSQLAEQLSRNRTLTKLNLSKNVFSAEQAKNFLNPNVLTSNCKIKQLIFEEEEKHKEKDDENEPRASHDSERTSPAATSPSKTPPTLSPAISAHNLKEKTITRESSGSSSPVPILPNGVISVAMHAIRPRSRSNSFEASHEVNKERRGSLSGASQSGGRVFYKFELLREILLNTRLRAELRAALFPEIQAQVQAIIAHEVALALQSLSLSESKKKT